MVFHTVLEVFWEVFLEDFSGIFFGIVPALN